MFKIHNISRFFKSIKISFEKNTGRNTVMLNRFIYNYAFSIHFTISKAIKGKMLNIKLPFYLQECKTLIHAYFM